MQDAEREFLNTNELDMEQGILALRNLIDERAERERTILVIYGNWGTGKSTLAELIGETGIGKLSPSEIDSYPYDREAGPVVLSLIKRGFTGFRKLTAVTTVAGHLQMDRNDEQIIFVELRCNEDTREANLMEREVKRSAPGSDFFEIFQSVHNQIIRSTSRPGISIPLFKPDIVVDTSKDNRISADKIRELLR